MLEKIAVAILVIVALSLIPLIATAQSESAQSRIPVSIQSRPDWAEVRIDAAFVGTPPLSYRLTPGVDRIALTRNQFESWSRDLTVVPDTPAVVTALLARSDAKPCR